MVIMNFFINEKCAMLAEAIENILYFESGKQKELDAELVLKFCNGIQAV